MKNSTIKNLTIATVFVGSFLLTATVLKKVKEYKELNRDGAIKEKVSEYFENNFPEQGKIYNFYDQKQKDNEKLYERKYITLR